MNLETKRSSCVCQAASLRRVAVELDQQLQGPQAVGLLPPSEWPEPLSKCLKEEKASVRSATSLRRVAVGLHEQVQGQQGARLLPLSEFAWKRRFGCRIGSM